MHQDCDAYTAQEPAGKENQTISEPYFRNSPVVKHFQASDNPDCYLWVLIFWSPDESARASAIVGMITRRFMYPLPAQVFAEVNVQAPHTAVLRFTAFNMKMAHSEAFYIVRIKNVHFILCWLITGSLGTNSICFCLTFSARFWWAVAVKRKRHYQNVRFWHIFC